MVARSHQYPRPALSQDQQAARIRLLFPQFRVKRRGGQLVIQGQIQPSPASRSYRVRITFRIGYSPRVYVESPELVSNANGDPPPHRFSLPGNPLCLFYTKGWEWSGHQYIADTIIPWASEYLLFYELWLATGEWFGGGIAHGTDKGADGEQDRRPTSGRDLHAPVRDE